jgi:transitional endoplasmic reticulum ATPase
MKEVPVAGDVSFADIAAKAEGYSGADMAELCDRAKRFALNRQLAAGNEQSVTAEDFAAALAKVRPTVSPEMLKEFESWRDSRLAPAGVGDEDE